MCIYTHFIYIWYMLSYMIYTHFIYIYTYTHPQTHTHIYIYTLYSMVTMINLINISITSHFIIFFSFGVVRSHKIYLLANLKYIIQHYFLYSQCYTLNLQVVFIWKNWRFVIFGQHGPGIGYLPFFAWFISLIMFSRFIHVVRVLGLPTFLLAIILFYYSYIYIFFQYILYFIL